MSNSVRQVQCLKRLEELNGSYEDILQFLMQEDLIDKAKSLSVRSSADKAKEIHGLLNHLSRSGGIQLLEYEWSVLPVERITLLIITNKSKKEITYGA